MEELQSKLNEYTGNTYDGTLLSTDTKYIALTNNTYTVNYINKSKKINVTVEKKWEDETWKEFFFDMYYDEYFIVNDVIYQFLEIEDIDDEDIDDDDIEPRYVPNKTADPRFILYVLFDYSSPDDPIRGEKQD